MLHDPYADVIHSFGHYLEYTFVLKYFSTHKYCVKVASCIMCNKSYKIKSLTYGL